MKTMYRIFLTLTSIIGLIAFTACQGMNGAQTLNGGNDLQDNEAAPADFDVDTRNGVSPPATQQPSLDNGTGTDSFGTTVEPGIYNGTIYDNTPDFDTETYDTTPEPDVGNSKATSGMGTTRPAASPAARNATVQPEAVRNSDIVENFEQHLTVIRFSEGSTEIPTTQRTVLQEAFSGSNAYLREQRIVVIAWSDKDFPASEEHVPAADQKLADNRAQNIESALRELGVQDVQIYTMAERTGWIANLFSTQQAQIKETYKEATGAEPFAAGDDASRVFYRQIADLLRAHGGPMTAVIGPMPREGDIR